MTITPERVRELLDYDPETGFFYNRMARANVPAGSAAGSMTSHGYIRISVDDKSYRAHRLAWLWMTGRWPKAFVDHRDTNKSNNRWSNLREATKSQNMANTHLQNNNKTGCKGVYFYKAYSKYAAQIWKDGQQTFLGYFDTFEQAKVAREHAARRLFGDFARAA